MVASSSSWSRGLQRCLAMRPPTRAAAAAHGRGHVGLLALDVAAGPCSARSGAALPGAQALRRFATAPSAQQPPSGQPPLPASTLQEELEAQQRLANPSPNDLSVQYVRCDANRTTGRTWRWLRGVSVDLNYDFKRWREHQKAFRHLALWTPANIANADNIRRLLFPDLAVMGAASGFVCLYNSYVGAMTLPMECFSITTVALGLLVTFKTRSCYDRFDDARAQWGLITNESRAISSRILARVTPQLGEGSDEVLTARRHALKLVQTFPHTLKYHVTEDGCNPHILSGRKMSDADIRAAVCLSLQVELSQIWDTNDEQEASLMQSILTAEGNRPLCVLHELSLLNSRVFADPAKGALHPIISSELDRSVTLFQHVLGRCERILRTPVYSAYIKLTSRFLYVWCSALPLGMYPLLGPVLTTPVTLLVSFFMLGIQDIGNRVEQPFDVLPLWQYCSTVDAGVKELIKQTEALDRR